MSQNGPSGISPILIVPRIVIPNDFLPPPPKPVDKTISSGAPTARRLVWHAFTHHGGKLSYTDSEACWDWANDDEHWMKELKREMEYFVKNIWGHAHAHHVDWVDGEFKFVNLENWGYGYGLSGTYTTRDDPRVLKVSFGGEPAENGYTKFNSKWWIHNTQVEIDYSITFGDDLSINMTADFTLIDFMNLETEKYDLDKRLDWLFYYKPYDLDVALGTHTIGWSYTGGLSLDGESW